MSNGLPPGRCLSLTSKLLSGALPVRVLQVISSINPSGGGPIEALKQLGLILLHQGHIVEVACLDAPDSSWLKTFSLEELCLGTRQI